MLKLAIALFVLAAVFGLIVLTAILRNKPTPKPVVFIHGGVAATALLIVIFAAVSSPSAAPLVSIVLFILAALGGFYLFATDMRGKAIPKWVALIHPLVAAAGLISLIYFVMK